ncbi:MAG: DUF2203 family protein [Planctomycetes bacterium]|nr:DUF2203 family protein [Planctomycetota bacterium]
MPQQRHEPEAGAILTLRMWSYPDARKAVPYFRSLAQSLRDGWLDLRNIQEHQKKLEAREGKPDRDTLIDLDNTGKDLAQAEGRLQEIIEEMMGLSAYCIDPNAGLVVIPFLRGHELAWFVFDLFDDAGICGWRLYTDPLETRRPLADLETEAAPAALPAPQPPMLN